MHYRFHCIRIGISLHCIRIGTGIFTAELNSLVMSCSSVEEEGRLQSLSHHQFFFLFTFYYD